jgi:hypothetical protein
MKVEDFENVQKFNELSLGEGSQVGNTILESVSGTNDIVANASPSITALVDGQTYIFTAPTTNTGAMTLTIDATSTLPIKKRFNIAMVPDDIKEDQIAVVVYSSATAAYELISTTSTWPYMNGILAKATDYTVELKDRGVLISVTGTNTITMLPVATAGDNFNSIIFNAGVAIVTIDGDGANINGSATIALAPGDFAFLTTDAIEWEGPISNIAHDHTGTDETQIPTAGIEDDAIETVKILDANVTYAKMSFSNDIVQGDIANSAIGQGELKTPSPQQTAVTASTNISFTGSSYTLGWAASLSGIVAWSILPYETGTNIWGIRLEEGAGAETCYFQARYITASEPYDLGDGDIPLFLEAIIDNGSGNILALNSSIDPVWANNGPTNIRPDRIDKKSGRGFKMVYDFPRGLEKPLPQESSLDARIAHQKARAEFMKTPAYKEIEITKEFKNTDMPDIPHHFQGNDLTGKTIVLLDPVSPVVEELMLLRDAGNDINKMIMDGYFNIDATQITRNGPPGVQVVSVDWKNTP